MKTAHRWITTAGGPHLLIAEEVLADWRGIQGWHNHQDPTDHSDYARACRVTTWLGSLACGNRTAVVLAGDVGDIAWLPTLIGEAGFLVQWLGVDDESLIEPLVRSDSVQKMLASPDTEKLDFQTGPSGALRLMDAAEIGIDLRGDSQVLALKPGNYRMRAGYVTSPGVLIVVREISRIWRVALGWVKWSLRSAAKQYARPNGLEAAARRVGSHTCPPQSVKGLTQTTSYRAWPSRDDCHSKTHSPHRFPGRRRGLSRRRSGIFTSILWRLILLALKVPDICRA
jgi:Immunity protein 21